MSKNYDNWERLVGAVLRRESDTQLAYSYSIDSVSSLDLSFNSIARFDEDDDDHVESNNYNDVMEKLARVVLQREGEMQIVPQGQRGPLLERIQYSDLQTIHHSDWKKMLLPHQNQICWRSASFIFLLHPISEGGDGINYFFVGSKNIQVLNDQPRKSNSNYSIPRFFPEVLEIYNIEDLNVGCKIKTQMLSPNTLYAAYLFFAFTKKNAGVPLAARSVLKILPYQSVYRSQDQDCKVRFEPANSRLEGWMEVDLGDFYVYPGEDREVQVQLMYVDAITNIEKGGLVVLGIEFRPSEAKPVFTKSNDDWVSPPTEKGQLLHIRTGNNSLMLGARALLISWEDHPSCWKWTTHDHSRFPEVVELQYVWWLKIRGRINTRVLPPKTDCAAFLVFNLAEGCRGLEKANGMVRFLDESSENDAEKVARVLNLLVAMSRADGWMEIEMGSFYVE